MSKFAVPADVIDGSSQVVVYDDEPEAIEMPGRRAGTHDSSIGPLASDRSDEYLSGETGELLPEGMILLPRRTIYLQGALFGVLALFFFAAGYFIGRGDATLDLTATQQEADKELVLVEGRLVYDPGTGVLAGDDGGVIVVLPQGRFPEQTIPIQGIRPQDPPPTENNKSIRAIADLGGAYTRADAAGDFSLILPDKGEYRILLISHSAARPTDQSIDELDQDEMNQYFQQADHLVNRYKYRWTLEELEADCGPITCDFGEDRKDDVELRSPDVLPLEGSL